jgi:tetratricopeptide (TPR) repeat protein
MDNMRCDLLEEMRKSYDKMKKNAEAAAVMQEKIQNCKGATVTDYFNLGRSYFFGNDFVRADSAFAKVNEVSPKYASGWLWRAKTNSFIDSSFISGLAKPYYEKYIEAATADTVGMAANKYKSGLIESYRYIAAYFVKVSKDYDKCEEYLKKILEQDPEDQEAKKGIESIEFERKNKKKPK